MRRTPRHAVGALIAIGVLLTAGLQAGSATAAPAPAVGHDAATTAAEQARVSGYWTADRMRAAEPLDLPGVSPADLEAVPGGEKTTVSPVSPVSPPQSTPGVGLLAFPHSGGPWTQGGDVVTTAGRVFFTYAGRSASCSGNAVTSANRSTVLTAGHCVKLDGNWHTNWVFVPAYHNGQTPYGTWPAVRTMATPQWVASENINYDVGAAVVGSVNGQSLTDVVGGQGVAFNTGYNRDMYAFGYPAAAPYDGSILIYCSGRTFQDPFFSTAHGMSCDMTGGSSGGPWFSQFNESTGQGLQSSVNSFGYNFWPGNMFGPYFGSDAQNLYQTAQSS